jgi:hypothetical protein
MKTMTSIDLFVQALLIFGLMGTGAASILSIGGKDYTLLFLLLLFLTGIWQVSSAIIGSFFHFNPHKSVYLAASVIYCSFLTILASSGRWISYDDQLMRIAQLTFVCIIPFFAAMLYFYLSVEGANQYQKAKKDAEFV